MTTIDGTLDDITDALIDGDAPGLVALIEQALAGGTDPERILREGLIAGMQEVGRLFEDGEFFVPEMLISARAMSAALDLLKPRLVSQGVASTGRVVIGTVHGDIHDIGKSLVAMMLEGAGFEVIDLGIDVSPERFVEAVRTQAPHLVAVSALLTTTMPNMRGVIDALAAAGLRGQVRVMVGGAPVTQDFADHIGADAYSPDAGAAARTAVELVRGMTAAR